MPNADFVIEGCVDPTEPLRDEGPFGDLNADTRVWVRAFFDGTERGGWTDLKRLFDETSKAQTEVTVPSFGTMWP